jgi:hypothetical protein
LNKAKINSTDSIFVYKKFLKFLKTSNLIITEADKNIGLVLIDKNIYNTLCYEHLNDITTYKIIEDFNLFDFQTEALVLISDLHDKFHLSDKIWSFIHNILKFDSKIGKFRILPKLHKKKLGIRPIINCKNTTNEILSRFIDMILQPIVKKQEFYIKDSQNLIQITKNLVFKNKCYLYSADFESLYTNIPFNDAITIVCDFVKQEKVDGVSAFAFHQILSFILKNNFFTFNDKTYLQIKGIAMGTTCAPSVANLYLCHYEILAKRNGILFLFDKRFIDDKIVIDDKKFGEDSLQIIYPIKLNVEENTKITFLDLKISIDISGYLNYDLHVKETHTGSYLIPKSNHPNHIIRNIPYNLILRIRRICTDYNKYRFHCLDLLEKLINRGYNAKTVCAIIRKISTLNRNDLVDYKYKPNASERFKIYPIIITYDKQLQPYYKSIHYYWNDYKFKFSNEKLNLTYGCLPNLQKLLVNKIQFPYNFGKYIKCQDSRCKLCDYANTSQFLANKQDLPIILPSNSSCQSSNCIYIITCKRCKCQYIGQTQNLRDRINNHLWKIKSYNRRSTIQSTQTQESIQHGDYHVPIHFNSSDHNVNDFSFQVFIQNIDEKRIRLETDLITILNSVFPHGLNIKSNNYLL